MRAQGFSGHGRNGFSRYVLAALVFVVTVIWLTRPVQSTEPMEEITPAESQQLADLLKQERTAKRPFRKTRKSSESVRSQFERLTGKALDELPRLSEMRRKGQDVHYPPPSLLDGSDTFADVAERVRKDPSLAPEAIRFYHACATTEDAPTAIRAVCLRRLKDLVSHSGSAFPVRESDYPELVRRVADDLPSTR